MVTWGLAQKLVRAKLQTAESQVHSDGLCHPRPIAPGEPSDTPELLLNEQGLVISLAAQEKAQQQKHIHGGFLLHQ